MPTVLQLTQSLEVIAPLSWAEEWDNCGLILGDSEASVKKVLLTLDVDSSVLEEAVAKNCQLIISHHPPIFYPQKKIIFSSSTGRLLIKASRANLNLYAAHTNFDRAPLGLSAYLAQKLGLTKITPLKPAKVSNYIKIAVFVPPSHLEAVFTALVGAEAGTIGPYDACSFRLSGEGTFRPLAGAKPYLGKVGRLESLAETRIEMVLPSNRLEAVVKAIKEAHPYEMPAYDIYPLLNQEEGVGLGRIGVLENPLTIKEIIQILKESLSLDIVRVSNNILEPIKHIAVVTGSGAELIEEAAKVGAQLLITGDLKYHDYQKAEELRIALLDAGHYQTEIIFMECLAELLLEKWGKKLTIIKSTSHKPKYRNV